MERINIWGENIPGNSPNMKSEVMEIKTRKKPNATLDTMKWIWGLKGKRYKNSKKIIDTYTATWVAKSDDDFNENFEDVPYLIPFIAQGSKKAVVVVPGGGYCAKSMEDEGTQVAEYLQKNNITAFVLWYRTNPYYQPIPLMDMQRAIRVVRYHNEKYGYDKNKIGAIGFSAGGAEVGLHLNIYQGKEIPFETYKKDEVDQIDDSLNFAAMIYPALSYNYNVPMLFASFPAQDVKDKNKRKELLAQYDAVKHMNSKGIPQFISYGSKETLVGIPQIQSYINLLRDSNTNIKEVIVEGAGHGYGASIGQPYGYWLVEYLDWLNKLPLKR
jgi:Esterase/lipase